ncbi:hypothetical protein YDYSY3_47720 [Paenibacillus chitinolyticus]|nr:hypothetical protein YDYSY3_47720 [Paenibacillus chitinolyticus]
MPEVKLPKELFEFPGSRIAKRLRCPVIDVTDKAIEETAGLIIEFLQA